MNCNAHLFDVMFEYCLSHIAVYSEGRWVTMQLNVWDLFFSMIRALLPLKVILQFNLVIKNKTDLKLCYIKLRCINCDVISILVSYSGNHCAIPWSGTCANCPACGLFLHDPFPHSYWLWSPTFMSEVTDGQVVRQGVSVTRNVLSWSQGHEFEAQSVQTWGA